jgi:hypothetical protein
MSEIKEPYKWYWAYTSPSIDGITYLFKSLDDAREHAIAHGEFDDIHGKDAFVEYDERLFFEVREDELEDYLPLEKAA